MLLRVMELRAPKTKPDEPTRNYLVNEACGIDAFVVGSENGWAEPLRNAALARKSA
jgi:hypothetical protein